MPTYTCTTQNIQALYVWHRSCQFPRAGDEIVANNIKRQNRKGNNKT